MTSQNNDNKVMNRFGNYIRELRINKNLTLARLASMLDIDSTNLSKVENGKRFLDEEKLIKLCEIFSLDIDEIKKEILSEKIAKKVYDSNYGVDVLKLAESKIKYLKRCEL